MEHFKKTQNQQIPQALQDFNTETLTTDAVVQVCEGPVTGEEVQDVIRALKNGKACLIDEISAELLKSGEETMTAALTTLTNRCWEMKQVPLECPPELHYYKVFRIILLRRLREADDKLLREEQADFRTNRSCTEQN